MQLLQALLTVLIGVWRVVENTAIGMKVAGKLQRPSGGAPPKPASEGAEARAFSDFIRDGISLIFGNTPLTELFTIATFRRDAELRHVDDPYQWVANYLSRLKRGVRTSHSIQRLLYRAIISNQITVDLIGKTGRFARLSPAEYKAVRDAFHSWATTRAIQFPALLDRSGKPPPAFIMPAAVEAMAVAIARTATERGVGRRNYLRVKKAAAAYLSAHAYAMAGEFAASALLDHGEVLNSNTMNGWSLSDMLFTLRDRVQTF